MKPDIVIIAGMRYPLQIIQLRLACGSKVKLIGRHHADKPPTGFRKILQRWADRSLNAYFFTSHGNAHEWIDAGIIKNKNKIHEINAASTNFLRLDKKQSRERTGMSNCRNFLWVGRLDANKDPITVLNGFEQHLVADPGAQLHMIYQEETLLQDLKQRVAKSSSLMNAVNLVGYVPYQQLQDWYSAADYFISGSHSEGGSFALLEAMACGCIPIVTNIPAAVKMIGDGRFGMIFKPGDEKDLAEKLLSLPTESLSVSVEKYFQDELSNKAVAEKIFRQCEILMAE
jgi:glycosyltransferase involved in cell wall biosynthesis